MYRKRYKFYIDYGRSRVISLIKRGSFIFLGACLVAISLQLFLVKNYLIDGGIIGIGIILAHVTGLEVGLLLLVLNTPFFFIGYTYLGKRFIVLSLYAMVVLTIGTIILEPIPVITHNPIFVIIFGGICLGLGVGIIIRFGGCLDGTEVMAILFSKRSRITIGQYVLLFNFIIFGSAVFIFGLKEALYSLATFIIAYKTIDFSIKNKA
ncbi:YitT family protein [Bacillus sp. BRMEA1]|uniref:YitT family protein n=1 Tax=Neobacillus endophyticus TaxID=2738405 RepID=UPI0015650351|nr:YitT family protein [Neobacillus endophyticus]NRD77823.1 YitT family protein [Neobacillus endophyticus]